MLYMYCISCQLMLSTSYQQKLNVLSAIFGKWREAHIAKLRPQLAVLKFTSNVNSRFGKNMRYLT